MKTLTWEQVCTWRLSKQSLLERDSRDQQIEVVKQISGLHAQMMSAAELSLWARVENLANTDVANALYRDRTLVKTWALRGTLHLLPNSEFPLFIAVLSTLKHFRRQSWFKYHGITEAELDALLEGIQVVLSDQPITREQLAESLASHTNTPKLAELLRSGWGALLKPAAFQGYLCFGENQGQNVTFVQPKKWLGEWKSIEPAHAVKELTRRFLTGYGPATIDEFARWVGLEPSAAKKAFKSLGDEISEVDVEGWKAWMLVSAVQEMEMFKLTECVRLLPHFDQYTIAVARHSQNLMPEQFKAKVYRQQGWISPVALVNGRLAGVWEYEKKRSKIIVSVELFETVKDTVKQGIEIEAKRLGEYFEGEVELTIV